MALTGAITSPTPMRGRDAERDAIGNALASLSAGRGCVIIVEGPAGIGKSRLVQEAMEIAERLGARVGAATAAAGHRVVPVGALLNAVSGGDEPLLSDAGVVRDEGRDERIYWLIQELESSLERRAGAGPVTIVIDDLQWADPGTVAAIEVLASRLAALPVAWLVALRAAEASEELTRALDRMTAEGALRLRLSPLSAEAVIEVVTDLTGAPPDEAMGELATSARGVPFWVIELLSALHEAGRIEHVDGHAVIRAGGLPSRTWDTTRHRLDHMTAGARELVSVASVLGRCFTFHSLQQMLGASATSLLSPVDELLRSGLLVEEAEQLAFRHDLLREGVLAALPASARQALERQAAGVLLASGAPPVEVALQLAQSASVGDGEAIDVLVRAVHALGASDPEAAAQLAQRTLELTPREDPRHTALVAETTVLLHAAGRLDDAMRFADGALGEVLSPAQESEIRLSISNMFSLSADIRADANRRALALTGLGDRDRARHQARLIHNTLAGGRLGEVHRLLSELADGIRASDDPSTLYALLGGEAGVRYSDSRFTEALALIEQAARAAAAADDSARATIADQWRSEILGALDRLEEAMRISDNGLRAAQRSSQAWAIQLWEQWRGRQMFLTGDFQDAIAMLEATFRPGEVRPGFGANDASALGALAGAALHVGDRRNLQRCEEIATLTLAGGTPELCRHAGWVLAQQAMATGDPGKAHERLMAVAALVDAGETVLPAFPADMTDPPQLVRIARAAGDDSLARDAVAHAEQRAALNPGVPAIAGAAHHARGLLELDRHALEAAVDAYRASQRRPALASALEDAAVAALLDGATEDAVQRLDRALKLTVAMDARWDTGRLRRRLRRLGVRRRMASAERPTHGWDSLTRSELAVVRAITGGMTNRDAAQALFLSPHTVGSHLRHVFAKLNINSRVDLARMAGEHPE